MSRQLTHAGGLLAGLVLLAGCGERPGYDASAVESHLLAAEWEALGTTTVDEVSCPDERELREGMTLTCTLNVGRARLPYRVTLNRVREEKVTVAAEPNGVLMSGARVTEYVQSQLPAGARAASVDCGGDWFVAKVGQSRDCTLRLGSQETPITVQVRTESGVVRVSP